MRFNRTVYATRAANQPDNPLAELVDDLEALPSALTTTANWIRHSADKVPLNVYSGPAPVTDPRTWATFTEARESKVGEGLGFVLDGSGVGCVDLDKCLTPTGLLPWAREIVDRLRGTYMEVSPSGRGVHIWFYGTVGRGRKFRVGGGSVEVYDRKRYMTVTGHRLGRPLELGDMNDEVAALIADLDARQKSKQLVASEPARACAFCGAQMDNPRRIQCGKPSCKRALRAAHAKIASAERRARLQGALVERFEFNEVFERDLWVCQLCLDAVDKTLSYPDPWSPSLDHIVPISAGGDHTRANSRLTHWVCNIRRGNRPA